ncbi:MAG: ribosome silencing factor [Verrucomicrobium sp.]|nr:ribosome silencing factor [Verrucomicrobium sp.]
MPATPSGLKLAKLCRTFAEEKKALDPVLLDLRKVSSVADFFLICSAESEPQLKAIGNGLELMLKNDYGLRPNAVDGFPRSHWVVVDYGDVMVHVFHANTRGFYSLEKLWGDAPRIA